MLLPTLAESSPRDAARSALALRSAAVLVAASVAGIWAVWIAEWLSGWRLSGMGIRPGEAWGLLGILTGPLLHGSFEHLVANTLPLLILGTLTLYFYPRATWPALLLIWLVGGLGVWLFGRSSVHLGASGLTHGLLFFLFLLGLIRRDRPAVVAALIAFFLYGGMLLSILPRAPNISWEYHLFGALGGIMGALVLRRLDPPPPAKRYSWDVEDDFEATADEEYELPRPTEVPVLWQRPERDGGPKVLPFPGPRNGKSDSDKPTLH